MAGEVSSRPISSSAFALTFFNLLDRSSAQTDVPMAVKIVFYVLIGLITAVYILGWGLEAMGRNRTIGRTDDGRQHAEKVNGH